MSSPHRPSPDHEPPAAAALPRPLAEQLQRTYPDVPCCLLSTECASLGATNPTGRYARWHTALLAERATWGLDERESA